MKNINRLEKFVSQKLMIIVLLITCSVTVACDPSIDSLAFDLPDANSQEDLTPPSALFSIIEGNDYLTYSFSNQSVSATMYLWEYGDGNSSTGVDGANIYSEEGTYTITLTATDNLGVSSTYTAELVVVEPEIPPTLIPVILEPGFDNGNDSRDVWRNSSLGGVIQITGSSGYHEGNNGAKLPDPGSDRIGYQLISEFTPNKTYSLTFKYRFKNDTDDNGLLHVSMLTETNDPADIAANTVGAITFSEDVAGVDDLISGTLVFNSGANSSLAIFFYNEFDESYIDSFEIEALD
ncbi:PKD domain-containing protein [uncultured Winogradskyella sp.]|uniref:PKD domain-containing protein n=1 Tax=uncultured Winogradskyella sp. TaxID=395353 RepID=UPI00260CAB60|nr:PKD domain-containing protein [uncultured Winogradskyella sp.]|tara:strand:- start:879 stop:1757 length:879 start_codon:yes stop_codon:yes gene_type:complete